MGVYGQIPEYTPPYTTFTREIPWALFEIRFALPRKLLLELNKISGFRNKLERFLPQNQWSEFPQKTAAWH